MKLVAPFILLAAAVGLAEASIGHNAGLTRIHHRISHRNELRQVDSSIASVNKKRGSQRCKPRPTPTNTPVPQNNTAQPESSKAPPRPRPRNTPAPPPPLNNDSKADNKDDSENDVKPAPSSSPAKPAPSPPAKSAPTSAPPPPTAPASGVINVVSSKCGPSGASKTPSKTNGPNGELSWLNCGIDGAGWTPPQITPQDLVTKSLADVVSEPNSPFTACKPFLSIFQNYANQHGLPDILIASIAMQESSCNPHTVGGAGEQGLMQITKDKCGEAPGGNCQDPDYNIRTGVAFFASTLQANNNNVALTMGMYNGWSAGSTVAQATAAAHTSCCRCQNNLDYLHQTFNGWCQGIDPIAAGFGQYFNLEICGN